MSTVKRVRRFTRKEDREIIEFLTNNPNKSLSDIPLTRCINSLRQRVSRLGFTKHWIRNARQ